MNDNKYKDAAEILTLGSVSEIREWAMTDFHRIKHTDSFLMILKRMQDMEDVNKRLEMRVAELLTHCDEYNQRRVDAMETVEKWRDKCHELQGKINAD